MPVKCDYHRAAIGCLRLGGFGGSGRLKRVVGGQIGFVLDSLPSLIPGEAVAPRPEAYYPQAFQGGGDSPNHLHPPKVHAAASGDGKNLAMGLKVRVSFPKRSQPGVNGFALSGLS